MRSGIRFTREYRAILGGEAGLRIRHSLEDAAVLTRDAPGGPPRRSATQLNLTVVLIALPCTKVRLMDSREERVNVGYAV